MDAASFRDVMRHQAGAVALICTGRKGERYGLTATAVCSLTDDPPTLLACVNKNASAHDTIRATGEFSVNLLALGHEQLAAIFSGQTELNGEDRFTVENYLWTDHASGTPCLAGSVASLDCVVNEQQPFSTHTIFIGGVRHCSADERAEPLIYCRGGFFGLSDGS